MVGCSSRGMSRKSAEERPGKLKCVGLLLQSWRDVGCLSLVCVL